MKMQKNNQHKNKMVFMMKMVIIASMMEHSMMTKVCIMQMMAKFMTNKETWLSQMNKHNQQKNNQLMRLQLKRFL